MAGQTVEDPRAQSLLDTAGPQKHGMAHQLDITSRKGRGLTHHEVRVCLLVLHTLLLVIEVQTSAIDGVTLPDNQMHIDLSLIRKGPDIAG